MKRLREEGDRVESINMARVLIFLSRGEEEARDSPGRVFECKTCNRQFPSFQALGGHRASHSKPRLVGDGQGQGQSALGKPKVHACSICGLEFPIGQALGGHMRRHRAATESFGHGLVEKKPDGKRALWLDLNLPPSEVLGDVESRKVGLSFEFVEKSPMVVDCFH
ncbi:zinc finger protein ZAT12-like [Phoenix dactylifera]|uniref:Zinc finger protein ZAT12-like n=1 Tax=Phoenix dactylifera TaxID=42345 RepID=A0A8B7CBC4_PHODC|nr:zinc finger protein ZAT12-like [Phoenix dactylifera]